MTRYFLITFIVAARISNSVTSKQVVCGPNEVPKTQMSDESDCCPEPKCQPTACPDPYTSPCKCDVLYLRAPNGTCIMGRDCPPIPCGENEMFDSCPIPGCSEACSNATPDGTRCRFVGRRLFTVICRPACRCIDKYWRDDDNKCVPYDKCPQFQTTCE